MLFIRKIVEWVSFILGIKNRFSDRIKINRLKGIDRFISGEVNLSMGKILYVDAPSLYAQYKDIVLNKIYKFSDKSNGLILDCGANIGLSSIYLSCEFPKARIIAFEPNPTVYKVLSENTQNRNVECIEAAVWDREGFIEMSIENSDRSSISSLKKNYQVAKVRSVRLKDYMHEPIDFLKIDIEGAEYEVMLDIRDKLNLVSNLFIEYHCMDNANKHLVVILDILSNNGFKYSILPEQVPNSPFMYKNNLNANGFYYQLNIFAYKD